jgi:hypothetical protein
VTREAIALPNLTDATQAAIPAGYMLELGFSSRTVAPGEISFFRVRLDAITPGTCGGTITIHSLECP